MAACKLRGALLCGRPQLRRYSCGFWLPLRHADVQQMRRRREEHVKGGRYLILWMIGRPQISKRRTVFGTLLVGGGSANRRAHGKHVTRLVWLLDPKPGQQKGGRRGVARGIMPSLVAEACSILGIEAGPSGVPDEEVIASAFKKLAIKWHPDRNPENVKEATQRSETAATCS